MLDWSHGNNIAVGLANTVFLWNFKTNKIKKLVENTDDNLVSGVKFGNSDEKLVVSSFEGKVTIYDLEKNKKLQQYDENIVRVGSLSLY